MAAKIQANYEDLAQAAAIFAREAQQTEQLLELIRRASDNVHGSSWVGRAADKYMGEMQGEVLPAVKRLVNALELSSGAIKRVADVMAQAEQQASSLLNRTF
jgi:WXG100 family type VII secretion target